MTASEEIRGRIKILFDKKPVQNVHLLVVRFTNNGNVPILPSDFYEPIKIHFGEETKILSADVVQHSPETFDPVTILEGQSLSIVPTLINSQDSFTIKFLLAQYTQGEMKISGRIVGVKAITLDTSDTIWKRLSLWSAVVALGSVVGLVITLQSRPDLNFVFWITLLISGHIFYAIVLSALAMNRFGKKP